MKISKQKKVTACETIPVVEDALGETSISDIISDIDRSKKSAVSSLYCALDSLSSIADKDEQAKSSIADIAYVILSLQ